jgi:hypothetical protein
MASSEEIERRLEATEATLQAMFCTVTADLIMFQAAVTALREEGVLTEKMIDRMAIDAQIWLQQYDTPVLSAPMATQIATQLDGLVERLRGAARSAPLVDPAAIDNGYGRGVGDARRPAR